MDQFQSSYGYPPGENSIELVQECDIAAVVEALESSELPWELKTFYTKVARIDLPDVGNGIFVDPLEQVLGDTDNRPRWVRGNSIEEVITFGSDGGGGILVIKKINNSVCRLSGGALVQSTYDIAKKDPPVIARTFAEFLDSIVEGIRASI